MKTHILSIIIVCFSLTHCKNIKKDAAITQNETSVLESKDSLIQESDITILPIQHASTILEWKGKTIYIDPAGGATPYLNKKSPDIVLITDIHGDHMDVETLDSLDLSKAKIIVPGAVAEKLPASYTEQLVIMNNGDIDTIQEIKIEAIPMYNLREEALKFHKKGRGNGYVITLGKERLYFSGDTEDIPEMRALQNIDKAFVCMNLPYTMTIESAADAVLDFKPKQVYPYHYRGTEGFSDVAAFKNMVNTKNPNIQVVQLDWYPVH